MGIEIFRRRCHFFKDAWNIFDLVIVSLTVIAIAMYIARMIFADMTISEFQKNKYKTVNFAHIAVWDETLMVFIATLVALTTVRLNEGTQL